MNEEIKAIFGDSIIVDNITIPVSHFLYKGSSKVYITWAFLSESPALCADDEDIYSICQIDIDIYSDSNYSKIIKEIKNLMKNNGWLWVEDSQEMYEEDTGLYHKTTTFEKERNL